METTSLVIAIIGLCIGVFGIVVPLAIGVHELRKRYNWERAMLASQLGNVWTEKTLEHRKVIEEEYGTYFVASKPIQPPPCEDLVNAKVGDELFAMKMAVISLMNYFEDIAVLYTCGMADKYIIDATLRTPLMRFYDKIKPLAQCIDNVAGYPSWKPLDDLVEQWKHKEARKALVKPKRFP